MILKGNTYSGIHLSFLSIPTAIITTNGYIQILWYQHKTQGGKCAISLAYKLPRVAMSAATHAAYEEKELSCLYIYTIIVYIH
jgi:hypothetical protein